jgi:hypothetical protein
VADTPVSDENPVKSALDALPPEPSAIIADELAGADPNLLAQLRSTQEPNNEQRQAVNELLATAVVRSMGADWVPNAHGIAVERAVKVFLEHWPLNE